MSAARDAFAARYDVPRGTLARFDQYAALLTEWQGRFNLVAPSTLDAVWDRHFADSAQLAALTPPGQTWLDMGAGAGFPGLVLALLGHASVTLVEATAKKCAFLQVVIDVTGAPARVANARLETLPPQRSDIITARALAPLDRLLGLGQRHARADTTWILPKGARAEAETAAARKLFAFDCDLVQSQTDSAAHILCLRSVRMLSP